MKDVITAFKLALLLVSYIGIGYLGYIGGIDKGRAEFHDELLQELDAKGGAPVLIYPPEGM